MVVALPYFQLPFPYCDHLAKHFWPYEAIRGGLLYNYQYPNSCTITKLPQVSITQTTKAQLISFSTAPSVSIQDMPMPHETCCRLYTLVIAVTLYQNLTSQRRCVDYLFLYFLISNLPCFALVSP